jgi:hypothetical protein
VCFLQFGEHCPKHKIFHVPVLFAESAGPRRPIKMTVEAEAEWEAQLDAERRAAERRVRPSAAVAVVASRGATAAIGNGR